MCLGLYILYVICKIGRHDVKILYSILRHTRMECQHTT